MAASIAADLDDAVARLLVHGGRLPGGSASHPLPFDPAASDAATSLRLCLAGWTDVIATPRTGPAATIPAMARWLTARINQVARHDAAPDIYAEVLDAVAMAVRVLDPPPELHPAGDCHQCGRQLMAEPGADHADCACGARVTGIRAARAQRAAAADVLGDAEAVSRALAAIGIRVSGGTIRQWVTRGRLTRRPGGVIAMSDVLALVAERDARR